MYSYKQPDLISLFFMWLRSNSIGLFFCVSYRNRYWGGWPLNLVVLTVDTAEDLAYDFCELFCLEKEKEK